jgi:hypothetical protein
MTMSTLNRRAAARSLALAVDIALQAGISDALILGIVAEQFRVQHGAGDDPDPPDPPDTDLGPFLAEVRKLLRA